MTGTTDTFLFPARVRGEVLAQHDVLRELLHSALAATSAGLQRQGEEVAELADRVRELRRIFCAHLAYEERALLPIIACDESWGPERAQEILAGHCRQRSEMETLVGGIEDGWDLERVSLTLRSLVVDLLRDMQEEEEVRLKDELLQEPIIDAPRSR